MSMIKLEASKISGRLCGITAFFVCVSALSAPSGLRRATQVSAAFELAAKWGAVFQVSPAWLLTIASIESNHDPKKICMRKNDKGGAWGLTGQMADEAAYKISVIERFYKSSRDVRQTLKLWDGTPNALLNPDLNMMIAAWQLRRLSKIFGSFLPVAAAYHQGEGTIKRRLARGLAIVGEGQAQGLIFMAKITTELPRYEAYALAHAKEQAEVQSRTLTCNPKRTIAQSAAN